MANNRIRTTSLDFDEIKSNLKEYLRGQQKFSDYDFEGSSLSILLDVLAYNTHINALYTNLAINEAFLDSASKRSSVVSKAKELGYVPMSPRCATAVVNVVMKDEQVVADSTIELPKYSPFTTVNASGTYTFYSQEDMIAYRNGNQYIFPNVTIKEGTVLNYQYVADGVNAAFIIPNPNIDTSTLNVIVQETAESSTYETYFVSTSMLDVDGNSLVYFLRENEAKRYVLEFGNGVVGKQLEAGNVVKITYMVGNQDLANGARAFRFTGPSPGNSIITFVTTAAVAYGGSAAEDIETIKWNAPRAFAAQNRCVTLEDYRAIVTSLYPNAGAIAVWGGESNIPPSYSDVFISIKPEYGERLSDSESDYLLNKIIGPRKVVTMHPHLVDPTYIYVALNTTFYYDPKETFRAPNDLAGLVRASILNYNDSMLSKFNGILKYSALSRVIDDSEVSIKNSITTIKLHHVIEPLYNQAVNYTINLGNPIYNSGVPEESILSNGFKELISSETVYIDDLPTEGSIIGSLRLFRYFNKQKVVLKTIGTVNYETGDILITNLAITGLTSADLRLIIKPQSNDVASVHNQIVLIPTELITVSAVVDKDADNYKFTSSRN